jgi:F420-non-reducing hydrogenase iron-sulfur subunit
MCSGRVDPVTVVDAFIAGADGVFVGACKRGECHYTVGNIQAEAKMGLTQKVLALAGVAPERLAMRWMSSAEGNKFVEYVTAFQADVSRLGPLATSGATLGASAEASGQSPGSSGSAGGGGGANGELALKLGAAREALGGRKLRWVVGKIVEMKEKGNLYDERFTAHEVGRLYDEITRDEYRLREILARLAGGPQSVRHLAEAMATAPAIVLRQMADLNRMGLARVSGIDGTTPLWAAVDGAKYE